MPEAIHPRLSRELFLTAFGATRTEFEPWVTDRLVSVVEEEFVRAGEPLFSAGDSPDFFFFMREGRVQVTPRRGPPGCVEGRAILGMVDALLDRPRTSSGVALSDLHLMRVQTEDWLELLDDSFDLSRLSVLRLAHNVAELEARCAPRPVAPAPRARAAVMASARPLDPVQRLAVLLDVPLLHGSGVQTLSDLAVLAEETFFAKGRSLFERSAPRERVYLVLDGEVESARAAPDVVRRVGPGEIVCGAAAFGEPALAWTARAFVDTRVLAFRVEDWFDLMEEHFDMVRSTLAALLRERERLLEELGPQPGMSMI